MDLLYLQNFTIDHEFDQEEHLISSPENSQMMAPFQNPKYSTPVSSSMPSTSKKACNVNINNLPKKTDTYQGASSTLEMHSKPKINIPPIVMVWCEKFQQLESQQKLFAEKAINDVLFEASQGTLHRHSVKINEDPLDEI